MQLAVYKNKTLLMLPFIPDDLSEDFLVINSAEHFVEVREQLKEVDFEDQFRTMFNNVLRDAGIMQA